MNSFHVFFPFTHSEMVVVASPCQAISTRHFHSSTVLCFALCELFVFLCCLVSICDSVDGVQLQTVGCRSLSCFCSNFWLFARQRQSSVWCLVIAVVRTMLCNGTQIMNVCARKMGLPTSASVGLERSSLVGVGHCGHHQLFPSEGPGSG